MYDTLLETQLYFVFFSIQPMGLVCFLINYVDLGELYFQNYPSNVLFKCDLNISDENNG